MWLSLLYMNSFQSSSGTCSNWRSTSLRLSNSFCASFRNLLGHAESRQMTSKFDKHLNSIRAFWGKTNPENPGYSPFAGIPWSTGGFLVAMKDLSLGFQLTPCEEVFGPQKHEKTYLKHQTSGCMTGRLGYRSKFWRLRHLWIHRLEPLGRFTHEW